MRKVFASDGYCANKYVLFSAGSLLGFILCLQDNLLSAFSMFDKMFYKIYCFWIHKKIFRGYFIRKQVYKTQVYKTKFGLAFNPHDKTAVSKVSICNELLFYKEVFCWAYNHGIGNYT